MGSSTKISASAFFGQLIRQLNAMGRRDGGFSCNEGPNLNALLDSAAVYTDGQYVYCVFRTSDMEGVELPLKVLGLFPTSIDQPGRRGCDYLVLVQVVPHRVTSQTLSNGQTTVHGGDIFLGLYNPYIRQGAFQPWK